MHIEYQILSLPENSRWSSLPMIQHHLSTDAKVIAIVTWTANRALSAFTVVAIQQVMKEENDLCHVISIRILFAHTFSFPPMTSSWVRRPRLLWL